MPSFVREDGEDEVEFEGELLAEFSTRRSQTQDRWSEVEVFYVGDAWLVAGVGRSEREGEKDFRWVHEDPTVEGLVEKLRLRSGRLPPATMACLLLAAQADPNLRNELMRCDL